MLVLLSDRSYLGLASVPEAVPSSSANTLALPSLACRLLREAGLLVCQGL
jgi:hypothetical protein